jgi:hypothetical protein
MEDNIFIRISDKLAEPISKLNRIVGIGLISIIIGFIFIFISYISYSSKFSVPIFIIGCILILCSSLIFLFIRVVVLSKAKRTLKENKVIIDDFQEISIELTRLTYYTQAYCYNKVDKIRNIADSFLILVKPFLGEKGNKLAAKVENISSETAVFESSTKQLVSDLMNSLENGDFEPMEKHKGKIISLSNKLKLELKK